MTDLNPSPDPTTEGADGRPRPRGAGRRRLLLPAIVLVGLLAVTAFLFADAAPEDAGTRATSTSQDDPESGTGPETDASQDEVVTALQALARRDAGDPLALGDVDAPVVMIAYSEFQCPFCGRFARETEPVLIEDYVEDGRLRIEWRDFPYLGEESATAAFGARAASQQDAFWEFAQAMFGNQQPPNSGRITAEFLADVAEGVGLDRERFLDDLESDEVAAAVARDFQEGQSIGVTGTPAFLINGRPVMGAQPTEVFVQVVEEALADAGSGR